ncbi:type II toxin-antitoxin system VapC family toxin [Luteolibacter sp. Populi]|uniref:type II toxin-antitoxin system VapC family toxin n=1 Tax=Luteolibacter sp. Populi TaxID=3230487 RepID=UPI003467C9F4
MIAYPDTSFLCSLYRSQEFSAAARTYRGAMTEPLYATSLLEFEYMQAIQLQVFLHSNDRTKGYGKIEARSMTDIWEAHLAKGNIQIIPCDLDAVMRQATAIARAHTATGGHRSLDILHLATAVHLGAKEFLSFDQRQIALARHLGLATPFA